MEMTFKAYSMARSEEYQRQRMAESPWQMARQSTKVRERQKLKIKIAREMMLESFNTNDLYLSIDRI